ncbi:MAG: hypothetical protein ACLP78_00935 [Thermoplasmata archaeon]
MTELQVCCEDGDPVDRALNQVPAVVKYGYPPTGPGPMWEHLRQTGFWVTTSDAPSPSPPLDTPEARLVGRRFAAAILWTAYRSGGIKWDRKTGLYSAP